MGDVCPDIGVSSEKCHGATAPRCLLREHTTTSDGAPCAPCTAHHWCDGGSDGGDRAGRPIVRWCAALVRREGAEDPWSRLTGPRDDAGSRAWVQRTVTLDVSREVSRGMRESTSHVLSLSRELRELRAARSHVPGAPVASWLREGMERGESIRALARSYRATYTAARAATGLHASDMDHSSAYAPDDARWASGASRTIRVRTPEGVQRTTVNGADVPSTAPAWRAPSHGRIAARRAAEKHGARLAPIVTAMVSGEAPIAASLSCDITALARGYSRAVTAVRRAETGLSDKPCEACLAAAQSRIVDALVARAWGHELSELDPSALATERERIAELHAGDVRRAESDALGAARACRAATERALLAWEDARVRAAREDRPEPPRPQTSCVCSQGVTRTQRKGRKGDRPAPVAIIDRGIVSPRRK